MMRATLLMLLVACAPPPNDGHGESRLPCTHVRVMAGMATVIDRDVSSVFTNTNWSGGAGIIYYLTNLDGTTTEVNVGGGVLVSEACMWGKEK